MAALTLVTLVLRGCSALCGASVNLRRGTSGAAYPTPEIDISMRHPTQDPVQVLNPEPWQEKPEVGNDLGFDAGVVGAGRLLCVGNRGRRHPARNANGGNALRRFRMAAKAGLRSAPATRSVFGTGTPSTCAWTRTPPAAAC
jgi:hypothetical protein